MTNLNPFYLFACLFLFCLLPINAQINCNTDAYYDYQTTLNPALLSREVDINLTLEEQTLKYWAKQQAQSLEKQEVADYELITIPVVVHLVYGNGESIGTGANLSNSRVHTAIDFLNEAYRNRTIYDPASGVDTRIEFCLASREPNGTSTDGINRALSVAWTDLVQSSEDGALKQNIGWDRNQYLNIWVVNAIRETATSAPNIAAYSSFPVQAGESYDGIVIIKDYFGTDYINNKVLVHEIGHYLGLYHPFRDGCTNNTCLGQGDFVCDTPPDALSAPSASCAPINSCTTDANDISNINPFRPVNLGGKGDQTDLIENYMDYSGYLCHTHFTKGQLDRMRIALNLYRASILNSNGCQTTNNNDVGITELVQPALFGCDNTLAVRLHNFGNNTIWNTTLNYQIDNGTIHSQPWNGTLNAGESVDVLLENNFYLPQAQHTFVGFTTNPNGTNDSNDNNSITQQVYAVNAQNIPFDENFESPNLSDKWLIVSNDNNTTWQKTWINGCWLNGNGAVYMNHLNYNEAGQKDYLITRLNLDNYANADLQFDVAYARGTATFADKLRVAVSTDCGYSFKEVYYKTGAALATEPNIMSWIFAPNNCSQWRTEHISLIDFAGNDVILAFETVNFKGNNLFIDNVHISGEVNINCHPPTYINNTAIGTNSLSLNWQNVNNEAESYRLKYRIANTANWTELYNIQSPYILTDLLSNTTYEVAVMSDCFGALFSDYGNVQTFTTSYDPCPLPINLTLSDVDKNFALLTWTAPTADASYIAYYRIVGTSVWFGPNSINQTQFLFDNLTVNTNYEMKLHTLCGNIQSAQYAYISFITAPDCSVPTGLIASSLNTNSATVQWDGDTDANSYRIEYREVGTNNWTNVTYGLTSYTINGLQQEHLYEVKVKAYCGATALSDFCDPIVFQTATPCYEPSYLHVTNQTQSSIELAWNSNTSSAQAYQVMYKKKGVIPWDTLVVFGTSATIWGLDECSEYLCRVKTLCSNNIESDNTPNLSVTTNQVSGYCCSFAQSSSYSWIRRVTFAGINNESGNNGGYAEFTWPTANVQQGMQYPFLFRLAATKKSNTYYWDVWIDYNQNLTFEDNEHVYASTVGGLISSDPSTQTGNITIPWWAATGTTKMRIALRNNEHAPVCGAYPLGEVEEYRIEINSGKTNNQADKITWQISPNPTQDFITLFQTINTEPEQSYQIELYNSQAQQIQTHSFKGNIAQLDLSQLPSGVYYIRLSNANSNYVTKIVRIE